MNQRSIQSIFQVLTIAIFSLSLAACLPAREADRSISSEDQPFVIGNLDSESPIVLLNTDEVLQAALGLTGVPLNGSIQTEFLAVQASLIADGDPEMVNQSYLLALLRFHFLVCEDYAEAEMSGSFRFLNSTLINGSNFSTKIPTIWMNLAMGFGVVTNTAQLSTMENLIGNVVTGNNNFNNTQVERAIALMCMTLLSSPAVQAGI